MKLSQIKKSKVNPRKMTKEAKKGLRGSMEQFGDISGIVFNENPEIDELVGGNHRWKELLTMYDKKSLELKQLGDTEFFAVYSYDEFTSYTIRMVNWDKKKHEAAKLTANNQHIAGFFTQEVDKILDEIKDLDFFPDINLGELYIDTPLDDVVEPKSTLKENEESSDEDFFSNDEDFDFSEEGFAEPTEVEEEVSLDARKANKIEVNILLSNESGIILSDLNSELTKILGKNHKVEFMNISAI